MPERLRVPPAALKVLPFLALLLFGTIVVLRAWVCDDAYITFRTIDNLAAGHGLTWNPSERVQAYTHPLWMLLMAGLYLMGRETFYTCIALSVALSISALAVFSFRLALSPVLAALGVAALSLSAAFTDYSTSGLENPLTHLLLALFVWIYLDESAPVGARAGRLSLLAALLALSRMDALLLVLPALAGAVLAGRSLEGAAPSGAAISGTALAGAALRRLPWRTLGSVAAGLTPLLAWEIFSLLYYGFPFPNTAYAKLGAGFGRLELTGRGVEYFANSAAADPVTLAAIGAGAIAPLVGRASPRGRAALVSAGIALHLLYVLSIGGDFMSGRFFTAPLLPAVALLARRDPGPRAVLAVAGCLAALWLVAPSYSPFARGARLSTVGDFQASIDDNGIADERSVYFPVASLRSAPPGGLWPSPGSGVQAIAARESWTADYWIPGLRRLGILDPVETWPPRPSPGRPLAPVVVRYAVGYIGFYAGPTLHILDLNALADPLLARLPALNPDPLTLTFLPRLATRGWRIGHFVRRIPAGYLETLATGENRIRDARLAEYYDRLRLITRGPLLAPGRLAAIWRMNTGAYDHLLAAGPGGAARDARRPSERLATRDPRGPARRAAARDACDPAQRFAARGLAVSHGGRRPTIAR